MILRISHIVVSALALSLLASAWQCIAANGVSTKSLTNKPEGRTGFTALSPAQTGLSFTNTLDSFASAGNRVLNNGSGVAAGDFDNDGLMDVFFCSLNQRNRLFRNLGNWKFKDVTEESRLRFPALYYRAAVFADVNSDGWLDLLVGTASQGVMCFLNDRQGHFTDTTEQANTITPFANETLTLADIDGNGTLDLYACNNRNDDIRDMPRIPVTLVNKKPTVPPHLRQRITLENGVMQEYGEPDILYLNDGLGHFRSASFTNGAFFDMQGEQLKQTPLDWGLAAAFRDLNGDGAPDLYVCNDYWTPDRLWINGGRGRFKETDTLAIRKIPSSSMGVDTADINRDGLVDIFAVDMLSRSTEMRLRQTVAKSPVAPRVGDTESRVQTPHNTLLLNRGDGTFAEIAHLAGVEASDWSWSPNFIDVDLDGYDDLLITSGHIRDIQDFDANDRIRALQENWRNSPMAATNLQRAFVEARRDHAKFYPPLAMPVVAYRNRGDLTFEEVTAQWGLTELGVNHGMVLADFDNDGDLDAIVNRLGSPAGIFRNDTTAPRIAVRLRGRAPNTQAIGAKIELLGGPVSNQVVEVTCGGQYMSGSDTLRVLAPGSATTGLHLRIRWRDGGTSEIADVKPNQLYEIDENTVARNAPAPRLRNTNTTHFVDASALLNHTHHEEPFDDFARQPLLPRKLSQGGPGLAWFDVNNDGWEDLVIGSGKGGTLAVYTNQQGKAFARSTDAAWQAPAASDQTSVLGWHDGTGKPSLLVGLANYESNDSNQPSAAQFSLADTSAATVLPATPSSTGPMSLADIDGDGDLDLFVGGQVIPGHYPAPASSRVFRQSLSAWTVDEENSRTLANIGLVNGSVWSDLNNDGQPDLLLTCEWGPLKFFRNDNGKLVPWEPEVRQRSLTFPLSKLTGLWQSITTGDFDGDGRLDIVAGNWGQNSPWRATSDHPLTLYYGNFARRDATDILEAEFDPQRGKLAPRHLRDHVAASIPWIAERFPTHTAWSRAGIADILSDSRTKAQELTATTLSTMVLLNRTNYFEVRPLPTEAQFAPTFGISVADFDGDGFEDLFLAQNFFAFKVEDLRLDASRGLLLRGDGHGGFTAEQGQNSGIQIHGEQRSAAVVDFDHDGRADLVVSQNGTATKLLRNTTAQPGLRITLAGATNNPTSVGATVRLKFADQSYGPAREIHCGSGYWSQDSSTLVLATPKPASEAHVIWPGGKATTHAIAAGTTSLTISPQAR